ncbi:unnamed protein product [Closterium sp. Yama58-4]|nr:unnamed protein product [Closterium sp. Yama58-4]
MHEQDAAPHVVALVGDSLSRQQFLSLLCLLAPRPRVLPPNHTRPVNEGSEGRARAGRGGGGGRGVALQPHGGAPVRGTARGAAVWLPGSNTTVLQRTSNLLCREDVLPAAVPVEEEGEEEEGGGEMRRGGGGGGGGWRRKGGVRGRVWRRGGRRAGRGAAASGGGGAGRRRPVVPAGGWVYEADEWLLQHLWRPGRARAQHCQPLDCQQVLSEGV